MDYYVQAVCARGIVARRGCQERAKLADITASVVESAREFALYQPSIETWHIEVDNETDAYVHVLEGAVQPLW